MDQNSASPRLELRVIGTIRTPFSQPQGTPIQPSKAEGARGTVWIDEAWREGLRDLDGFERIWLIYWLHQAPPAKLTVTPFLDTTPHGLFATRAPARVNPLGMSAVRLLKVAEDHLEVADVDIVDGTPLLEIKPYVPAFDSYPQSRAGWFDRSTSERQVADDRFAAAPRSLGAAAAKSELRLLVPDMDCHHCVDRAFMAIDELDGVDIDELVPGRARLSFDPARCSAEDICNAIEALGFAVRRENG